MAENSPATGAFVFGLFLGVFFGGLASLLATAVLVGILARFAANAMYAFIGDYALGLLLGVLAIRLIRERLDFTSGLTMGGAASFLGVAALCNTLVGGLGSTH